MTRRALVVVEPDDADPVDITEDLRVLYDAATGSLNWGSGFLDTDEVEGIRRLAAAMGFEDVDYPLDRCVHCDHDPGIHYTRRAGGTDRPCRTRSYPDRVPCPCSSYERRTPGGGQ